LNQQIDKKFAKVVHQNHDTDDQEGADKALKGSNPFATTIIFGLMLFI
jgi:hypothetical protein